MIVSMSAKVIPKSNIQPYHKSVYGMETSLTLISKITDKGLLVIYEFKR